MRAATRSLYFENSAGRIWEEPKDYLRLEYYAGNREEIQFQALLMHLLHALRRRGTGKILVDQRAMAPFNTSEQAWMATEWLPRAVLEGGYRYGAVIVAHNVFARLVMTQLVMSTRNLPHTYRTFDGEEAALAWLLTLA